LKKIEKKIKKLQKNLKKNGKLKKIENLKKIDNLNQAILIFLDKLSNFFFEFFQIFLFNSYLMGF